MNTPVRELPIEVDPDARGEPGRVLVTNDDGIHSPGLRLLARTLAQEHDVVVAAPAEDFSGTGTSIGRVAAEDPTTVTRADFDGIEAYAIDGTPGLAVMSAALGAFGPRPEIVVSGVNAGLNTGASIIHSGTVGAALTAYTFGISGIALSLGAGDRWDWDAAMPVALGTTRWMHRHGQLTALNVNVPAVADGRPRRSRWATIDHFGHVHVTARLRDGATISFDVSDRDPEPDPATDTALVQAGFVTLTLLSPLGASPPPDEDADLVAGTAPEA